MKILFSVGEIEDNYNANTKIVLQIAEKLYFCGHDCCIAGVNYGDKNQSDINNKFEIKKLSAIKPVVRSSIKFEKFLQKKGIDRNNARKLFIKRHPISSAFLFLRYTSFYREKIEQPRYLRQIKRLSKKIKPDAIICVYKPINSFEIIMNSDIDVPKFAYQLDPWGLHRIDNKNCDMDAIERETAVFEKAKHIFTTPILKRQYAENPHYQNFLPKMTELEFPNIKQYDEILKVPAIDFDKNYINILFSGIVSDEYRDPKCLLENLACLFTEKIRVYFMGTNNSKSLDEFIAKYPNNIFFVDKVDMETAFVTMQRADILVNISNDIDNQVPSKIFDYFSMGKPIINVQKIENCPASEYFEKYPLAFNIKEYQQTNLSELKQFIYNSIEEKVSFREIKEIYKTATVDYVAEKIEKVLGKSI